MRISNLKSQIQGISLMLLLSFLLVSCSPEEANDEITQIGLENKRVSLVMLKSKHEIKEEYSKLSFSEKKAVWINKIKQVENRNLSERHNTLLLELIDLLGTAKQDTDWHSKEVETVIVSLLKITPKNDFIQMFMSLDDYNESFDTNKVEYDVQFLTGIQKEFEQVRENSTNSQKAQAAQGGLMNCDCKWTCGWTGADTHTNCKPTKDGCGLLWMSPCTETDFPR
ncbi:bacteriocin fulvocin C-related protein [Hugenholtzia roseola]|uniref:bacteriocin fulvocin C-related protein n=1 Tax=Hugenholtzia roseola TaxID=1002 RepID=UPI00047A1443|nr:bacteriocin fulvocin C-related protein [Hugenholtzia roseola]